MFIKFSHSNGISFLLFRRVHLDYQGHLYLIALIAVYKIVYIEIVVLDA